MQKLKKLFENIPNVEIKGSKELKINGICIDSRCAFPKSLFIARKGKNFDGADFIKEAVSSGSVAVLTDMYNPFLKNTVQIIHKNVEDIIQEVAARYYDFPSKELFMIGLVGTNGKTTTNYLIYHILNVCKKPCGLIGTIEYILGENKIFSSLTTPDSVLCQKFLKEMVLNKKEACSMEVSSHAIDQKREKNIDFNIGIFTNISKDHLDYHRTFENYVLTKKKFFDSLKEDDICLANLDSLFFSEITKDVKAKIFSYSIKKRADFMAQNIKISLDSIEFIFCYKDIKEKIKIPNLIGEFNVLNALASIAAAILYGLDIKEIKKSFLSFKGVKGRCQRIESKKVDFFIDFAHSENGLKNILKTLNVLKKARIITVFGCGGNRDKEKRAKMGKIASLYSDLSIITTDNPRNEDPKDIINDIIKGFEKNNFIVSIDRYEAIKKAYLLATEKDIILVAGKGHETTQIFANKTVEFDDSKVILDIVR